MLEYSENKKEWTDISQFDIASHELPIADETKKAESFTDIGEAQVVSTLFGKAKVRVIHRQSKSNQWWILLAVIVAGAAGAIWLERLIQSQSVPARTETLPAMDSIPHAKEVAPAKVSEAPTPPEKKEPVKINPPVKPLMAGKPRQPALEGVNQPAQVPAETPQAVRMQPRVRPASHVVATNPVATTAAAPLVKKEPPATSSVAETLPENASKVTAPASIEQKPATTSK